MITLKVNFNKENNNCNCNYASDESCTLEHIYGIRCLIEQILKNDITMDWETIKMMINNTLVENKKTDKKKRKKIKNGKSNN